MPIERDTSGRRRCQLTASPAQSYPLYNFTPSVTADDRYLIFPSERFGPCRSTASTEPITSYSDLATIKAVGSTKSSLTAAFSTRPSSSWRRKFTIGLAATNPGSAARRDSPARHLRRLRAHGPRSRDQFLFFEHHGKTHGLFSIHFPTGQPKIKTLRTMARYPERGQRFHAHPFLSPNRHGLFYTEVIDGGSQICALDVGDLVDLEESWEAR